MLGGGGQCCIKMQQSCFYSTPQFCVLRCTFIAHKNDFKSHFSEKKVHFVLPRVMLIILWMIAVLSFSRASIVLNIFISFDSCFCQVIASRSIHSPLLLLSIYILQPIDVRCISLFIIISQIIISRLSFLPAYLPSLSPNYFSPPKNIKSSFHVHVYRLPKNSFCS